MRTVPVPVVWWRVVAGFALAPLVSSFAFACWQPAYLGLGSLTERVLRTTIIVSIVGGYPAAVLFGIPAYLLLRSRVRANPLNCALTGAVVASLPWLLVACFSSNPQSAFDNGHVTVEDGVRTWWGWLDAFTIVGEAAAFGALAGAMFWFIAGASLGQDR